MVSEERRALLDFWWDVEDPYDPESMEWREELTAEEAALVASWDEAYARGIRMMSEDILALSEGR